MGGVVEIKHHKFLETPAVVLVALLTVVMAGNTARSDAPEGVGVVCQVKVLSEHVPDVSSLEAWRDSFIKPGMTEEEKALAIWRSVVAHQHQDSPPREYLHHEDDVHDPIKLFNVYGYGYCSMASSNIVALGRALGMEARSWTIRAHVVPEVYWEGCWHMLDGSLINYFRHEDGRIASVEEIVAAVSSWLKEHPELRGNDAALREFHRDGGWTGWRRGPKLLARCPFYGEDGWLPAGTHGWYSTMQEYDGSTLFLYESGYSMGYRVNIQLRPGERLVRNWFNKGLHVNMRDGAEAPGCLTGQIGSGSLRYAPQFGDLAPGRVGNGTLVYQVPLKDPNCRLSFLKWENIVTAHERGSGPPVQVAEANKPAVLEWRMPSSYVYLSGKLQLGAQIGPEGRCAVVFSDNHGLDWKEVARVEKSGEYSLDLTPYCFRRYDYRLRVVLYGAGSGLTSLRLEHDIQHSQRPLPALKKGRNILSFSAGPPHGTITLEASTNPKNRSRQLVCEDFAPELINVDPSLLRLTAGQGSVTFRVATPGPMVALRFGCFYRARDAQDHWDLQVSFDGGQKFHTVDTAAGPRVFGAKYVQFTDIPAETTQALVRFAGTQRNTTCIFNFRIDADYREVFGGFRPVKITYLWEEGGIEKQHTHVAKNPAESFEIYCDATPRMRSLIVELAEE